MDHQPLLQRRLLTLLVAAIFVSLYAFVPHSDYIEGAVRSVRQSPLLSEATAATNNTSNNTSQSNNYFELYCQDTPHRCATLDRSRRFSFLHISKSGGASWINELELIKPGKLYPKSRQGPEWGQIYQNKQNRFDHLSYHLAAFRSPRHHTWSLWSECRFDGWGQRVTRDTAFPRSGQDADGDLRDFITWMDHFVDDQSPTGAQLKRGTSSDSYNCYHPANYQSRPLVTDQKNPHKPTGDDELVPSAALSNQTYYYYDWVAVTEFYHESKCLLYYRIQPRTLAMQEYLDQTCHCRLPTIAQETKHISDVQNLHHDGRRRQTMRDLDPTVLAKIQAATETDVTLYKTALEQFLTQEIPWLEAALGRRVVCDKILDKWEPELAYLDVSVKALYNDRDRDHRLQEEQH